MVAATAVGLAVGSQPAGATWSIVAGDEATGQVGAAIASCVPIDVVGDPNRVLVPVVVVPGRAVAVTQAALNLEAPDRIRELVAAGATPAEIVSDLTDPEHDPLADLRQHAVVGLGQGVAAATGHGTEAVALDRTVDGVAAGSADTVAVQGNLLVSEAVVDDTLAAYLVSRDQGDDLATGLVRALVAGSQAGGDRRCGDQTALFAQVVVADPGDDPGAPRFLTTTIVDQGDGQNPVQLLAQAHDQGRHGFIDAGTAPAGSGGRFQTLALVVAAIGAVVAVVVFRRGLGSVAARR